MPAVDQTQSLLHGCLTHVYINMKQSAFFIQMYTISSFYGICCSADWLLWELLRWLPGWSTAGTLICPTSSTLHCSGMAFRRNSLVYMVVTDYMNCDKQAVDTFNAPSSEKWSCCSRFEVNIFSDGAAQHFKQNFTLNNITAAGEELGVSLDWHFLAISHGKDAAEGIGGSIKRAVWTNISARLSSVTGSKSLITCPYKLCKATKILRLTALEEDCEKSKLEHKSSKIVPEFQRFKKYTVSGHGCWWCTHNVQKSLQSLLFQHHPTQQIIHQELHSSRPSLQVW